MMKLTRRSVSAAVCWLAGAVLATTVTIDPGNGVETNVTERFTGEVDLVVNSGSSGGGIVRLNTLNSYSGTTTLGCGTLVASAMSATGHVSSVGADGLLQRRRGRSRQGRSRHVPLRRPRRRLDRPSVHEHDRQALCGHL